MAMKEEFALYRLAEASEIKFIYLPLVLVLLTVFVPRSLYFTIALYAAMLFYSLYYFSRFRKDLDRDFGLASRSIRANFRKDIVTALTYGVSFFVISFFALFYYYPENESFISQFGFQTALLAIPVILVLRLVTNFIEELFWRGLVLGEMVERFEVEKNTAIVLSSLTFGFWCLNAWFFPSKLFNFIFSASIGFICGYLFKSLGTERIPLTVYTRTIVDVLAFVLM